MNQRAGIAGVWRDASCSVTSSSVACAHILGARNQCFRFSQYIGWVTSENVYYII